MRFAILGSLSSLPTTDLPANVSLNSAKFWRPSGRWTSKLSTNVPTCKRVSVRSVLGLLSDALILGHEKTEAHSPEFRQR